MCGCTDRSLCYSTKIITSTNQHIYNFVHQNMLYREKIYTCVYCCWCSSQNMYIRVQKYASIYYLQNSTQFTCILLLDSPIGNQYNIDSELCRVKRKLYYTKPSCHSPFLFSSDFGKGLSHATRLMTVYISRAVVFKDCVFRFSDQGEFNCR